MNYFLPLHPHFSHLSPRPRHPFTSVSISTKEGPRCSAPLSPTTHCCACYPGHFSTARASDCARRAKRGRTRSGTVLGRSTCGARISGGGRGSRGVGRRGVTTPSASLEFGVNCGEVDDDGSEAGEGMYEGGCTTQIEMTLLVCRNMMALISIWSLPTKIPSAGYLSC